jgi:hypothetical protein
MLYRVNFESIYSLIPLSLKSDEKSISNIIEKEIFLEIYCSTGQILR